jgi:hypothetical protein
VGTRWFDRLLLWSVFGVVCGLIPLGADSVVRSLDARAFEWPYIGKGQLLLVAITVASPSLGALLVSTAHIRSKVLYTGLLAPSLVLAGVFYGRVAAGAGKTEEAFVERWSLIISAALLAASGVATLLARPE